MLDDNPTNTIPIEGVKYLGSVSSPSAEIYELLQNGVQVHAAIGDAKLRRTWLEQFEPAPAATIVHPTAVLSPSACVDPGVFIGPMSVVNARAHIEQGAIINSSAIVEHDVHVGAFAHIAPGAILAGGAVIGNDAFVGAGSVVLPGVHVGPRATLGAGSVALHDICSETTAVGTPAR